MHIAYAVLFFFYVGLCETLRHGVFGLTPSETTALCYGTLVLIALVILRGDVVFLLRRPHHALYGSARLNWTWRRSALGIALVPLLWAIPVLYTAMQGAALPSPLPVETLLRLITGQVLLYSLAEELFLREAAIKAFHSDTRAIVLISTLSGFIFHLPQGVAPALIGAGTGLFFLTIRLIGTNLIAVALAHALTAILFVHMLSPAPGAPVSLDYALWVFGAAALLSLALARTLARKRRQPLHA